MDQHTKADDNDLQDTPELDSVAHVTELIKVASPFFDKNTQNSLNLIAQFTSLISTFNNMQKNSVSALSLSFSNVDFEGLLHSIRPHCNEREIGFVDRFLNIFSMRRMFETYQNVSSMMQQVNPGETSRKNAGSDMSMEQLLTMAKMFSGDGNANPFGNVSPDMLQTLMTLMRMNQASPHSAKEESAKKKSSASTYNDNVNYDTSYNENSFDTTSDANPYGTASDTSFNRNFNSNYYDASQYNNQDFYNFAENDNNPNDTHVPNKTHDSNHTNVQNEHPNFYNMYETNDNYDFYNDQEHNENSDFYNANEHNLGEIPYSSYNYYNMGADYSDYDNNLNPNSNATYEEGTYQSSYDTLDTLDTLDALDAYDSQPNEYWEQYADPAYSKTGPNSYPYHNSTNSYINPNSWNTYDVTSDNFKEPMGQKAANKNTKNQKAKASSKTSNADETYTNRASKEQKQSKNLHSKNDTSENNVPNQTMIQLLTEMLSPEQRAKFDSMRSLVGSGFPSK